MSALPPDVLARLRPLRLHARRGAIAHGLGAHASVQRGSGLEFAQYRAYEPGDDPRQVDWKLFARSDRYFVREAERESPLVAWIVLDASASMGQADQARRPRRAGTKHVDADAAPLQVKYPVAGEGVDGCL